ncbi:MAG TPA: carbohydrate ABC transporter permease [Candidatus Omnitrophota bacterium]|nr:carbohydrate ABC transporter permease [Candidatus Omnitrophota bacterium]
MMRLRFDKYILKDMAKSTISHGILLAVSLTCIFPLVWMFSSSLKTQQTIFKNMSLWPGVCHWENYITAWTRGGFGIYFLNSVFYTVTVVVGLILIASLAAYAFSRLEFKGKNIIYFTFLAAMMIPIPGSFIALYVLLVKLGLVNTRLGYILPQISIGLSLAIYLLKTFFDEIPKEIEDSAAVDGCSPVGIWWHIALPLAKPAIAVIAIFNALAVWNEYILAMIILQDKAKMPLQRGLMIFQGAHFTEYPLPMAGITLTAIPIIIIYLVMQRYIIEGITAGAVKG